MSDPWEGFSYSFDLTDVRIIAAVLDGGAILEMPPLLRITEGRSWAAFPMGEGYEDRLEYTLAFSIPGGPDPETGEAIDARLIVEGKTADGELLEIRGEGWVGYDDLGRIEGYFYEAPAILIGEGAIGDTGAGQPRVSDQYVRAKRMRPPREEFRVATPNRDMTVN